MSKTKAQLEEENEAQRAMLAEQRKEIEALYDILAAIGESRAYGAWIVGYAGSITPAKLDLLHAYAAAIRAKDADPPDPPATPDPNACECGHPVGAHIYTGTQPCTQCDCQQFRLAVSDQDAAAILVIVEDDDPPAIPPQQAKGSESWCAATTGDGDFAVICNSQPGHDGPVHVAWAADGGVVACWHVTVTASAGAA